MLPSLNSPTVIIPAAQVKWLAEQADTVLSAAETQRELLQTDYSLLDPRITHHGFQEVTIRRDLTRAIGGLIPEIENELHESVAQYWGNESQEWTEVCVLKTAQRIVTRTSNRVFVGLPLCMLLISYH